jgi:hypothetical protein
MNSSTKMQFCCSHLLNAAGDTLPSLHCCRKAWCTASCHSAWCSLRMWLVLMTQLDARLLLCLLLVFGLGEVVFRSEARRWCELVGVAWHTQDCKPHVGIKMSDIGAAVRVHACLAIEEILLLITLMEGVGSCTAVP